MGLKNPTEYPDLESGVTEVAICGIGMRLPGGIRNADDFWDILVNGKDTRGSVPASRYNAAGFTDSLGGGEFARTMHGYFIDEELYQLDTSMFTFTKSELEQTDPQHRILLEVARECLEDAGEVNYRGERIGCYVGTFGDDWLMMNVMDSHQLSNVSTLGYVDLMMANRISYEFDLKGPRSLII